MADHHMYAYFTDDAYFAGGWRPVAYEDLREVFREVCDRCKVPLGWVFPDEQRKRLTICSDCVDLIIAKESLKWQTDTGGL